VTAVTYSGLVEDSLKLTPHPLTPYTTLSPPGPFALCAITQSQVALDQADLVLQQLADGLDVRQDNVEKALQVTGLLLTCIHHSVSWNAWPTC
jgi:hypothetical protein